MPIRFRCEAGDLTLSGTHTSKIEASSSIKCCSRGRRVRAANHVTLACLRPTRMQFSRRYGGNSPSHNLSSQTARLFVLVCHYFFTSHTVILGLLCRQNRRAHMAIIRAPGRGRMQFLLVTCSRMPPAPRTLAKMATARANRGKLPSTN